MMSLDEYLDRRSAFFVMLDKSGSLLNELKNVPPEPVQQYVEKNGALLKQINSLQETISAEHAALSVAKAFYDSQKRGEAVSE